jgi:hypothetical protein
LLDDIGSIGIERLSYRKLAITWGIYLDAFKEEMEVEVESITVLVVDVVWFRQSGRLKQPQTASSSCQSKEANRLALHAPPSCVASCQARRNIQNGHVQHSASCRSSASMETESKLLQPLLLGWYSTELVFVQVKISAASRLQSCNDIKVKLYVVKSFLFDGPQVL